jgi:hypothetical protein
MKTTERGDDASTPHDFHLLREGDVLYRILSTMRPDGGCDHLDRLLDDVGRWHAAAREQFPADRESADAVAAAFVLGARFVLELRAWGEAAG